jgi:uncharacterized protein YktA (UPF0223 family)
MSIQVGIVENVTVVSAVVNDKLSLEVNLREGESAPADLFAAMNSGASMEENTQKLLFFPVDNKFYGKEATAAEMVMKFRQLTAKLAHLISNQVADPKFNAFVDTGITTSADINENILKEDVIAKMSMNVYTQFVEMVKNSDTSKKSRVRFVRQSAAKHYATLPEILNFKKDGGEWSTPFVESMEIPKAQSKLAYSKKEIEKGLNSGAAVTADAPDVLPF